MVVFSEYCISKMLNALKQHTSSGNFDGPLSPGLLSVCLFNNNTTPLPNTILSALTEPTFDGYAAVTPAVWESPFQDLGGNYVLLSALNEFQQTGLAVTENVYGWFLKTSADSGKLLMSEVLDEPINFSVIDRALTFAIRVQLGIGGFLGQGVIVS